MAPDRVAFLVHWHPVLSEAFVLYQAAALARAGCAVDLVPVEGLAAEPARRHAVQDEIEARGGVRAPRFMGRPRRRALAAPGALARLLARRGAGALRTLDPRRFGPDALSGRALMVADALCAGEDYDLIHCQFATIAPLALSLRAAGLTRARVVVHLRGHDITSHVEANGPDVHARAFREADRLVANCAHFRDRAVALGCDPGKIDVVPSGSDLSRFRYAERRPAPDGRLRVLAIGRLVEKKGFAHLIEAVRLLRAEGLDATARIAGEGPLRPALEAAIERAGLGGAVRLLGAMSHEEIAREFADADLFVAASTTASSGDADAPVNTVKEALASGVPVVATRHGGIPELVRDGIEGLLCAEGDAAALAARIRDMVAAGERWGDFARRGRARVEETCSIEVATRLLLDVYARAMASAPRPAPAPAPSRLAIGR